MPLGEFELVTVAGGARAVRHVPSGEVMHPGGAGGPWHEANALYVAQSRLAARLQEARPEPLVLYDVGLGGATNLAAALSCAAFLDEKGPRRALRVVTFERDLSPLRLALDDAEGFAYLAPHRALLEALVEKSQAEAPGVSVTLLRGDAALRYADAEGDADVVFFDPFSPSTNGELWTPEAFARLRARCSPEATLFTYSAATPTRVSLLLAGFAVGVGDAIGTKRETTAAATAARLLSRPLDARFLERWRRSSHRQPHGEVVDDKLLEARLAEALFDTGALPAPAPPA